MKFEFLNELLKSVCSVAPRKQIERTVGAKKLLLDCRKSGWRVLDFVSGDLQVEEPVGAATSIRNRNLSDDRGTIAGR